MKRRKNGNNKKRFFAALIAGIIIFVMIFGTFLPMILNAQELTEESAQITIDGKVGFDGRYKLINSTPFMINLSNNGDNFAGKVQVKIDVADPYNTNATSRYQLFSEKIELPAGATKQVNMSIPITQLKNFFTVELIDDSGKMVSSKNIQAKGVPSESIFVGVLTDNKQGLNYLKNLEINNYYAQKEEETIKSIEQSLFFLDNTTLPTEMGVLDCFNIIIVNDYDSKKLSKEQLEALKQWLSTGGILVLGTGAGYDKVVSAFNNDFVKIVNDGKTELSDLFVAETYRLKQKNDKPIEIEKIYIDPMEALMTKDEVVFTASHTFGNGIIVVHPFDLGVEPFVSLEGRDKFLSGYYRQLAETRYYNKMNYGYFDYLYSNLPPLNDSTLIYIFVIIFVYAILAGPVIYAILKKKDIREKGFFFIPVMAVVTIAMITVISQKTAYKKPIINSIVKIMAENGQQYADANITTGVFTPDKGNINLTFDKNIPVNINLNDYNYYRMNGKTTKSQNIIEIEKGATPKITYFNAQSWDTNSYMFNTPIDLNGGIVCDFYLDGSILKGTAENKTGLDFSEILIGLKGTFSKHENFKNGDILEIEQKIDFQKEYYDMYQTFIQLYGDIHDQNSPLSNEEKRMINIKQNLLTSSNEMSVKYAYSSSPRYYGGGSMGYSATSYAMPVPAVAENMFQKAINVDVYAFSFDKVYDLSVKINEKTPNEYNTNLINMSVPLDISKMKKFDFPFGLLSLAEINCESLFDRYNDVEIILRDKNADVEFIFEIPKNTKLELFQVKWNTMYGEKFIYNFAKAEYEDVASTEYSNPADYINENGKITLKLTEPDSGNIPLPQLRIKGEN